jgi:hypothetical protein
MMDCSCELREHCSKVHNKLAKFARIKIYQSHFSKETVVTKEMTMPFVKRGTVRKSQSQWKRGSFLLI